MRFCEEYGFSMFIISSWSEFLGIDLSKKKYTLWNKTDRYTKTVFEIIQPFAKYTIGISPHGDREYDIIKLQEGENKIIIIDDMDLSFLENKYTKYFFVGNGKFDYRQLRAIAQELE